VPQAPRGMGSIRGGRSACPRIFSADRTDGRAYATVLRPSVVCRRRLSVRNVLWLNGASYSYYCQPIGSRI